MKGSNMPLKYEILEEVKRKILEEPARLDMDEWGVTGLKPGSKWSWRQSEDRRVPACGTVGCIAGWVGIIVDGKIANGYTAEQLLGLVSGSEESLVLRRLFHVEYWSEENHIRHDTAKEKGDLKGMAEACAAEIDLVIQHYRGVKN
jgi:hypothetical protein